MNIVYMWLDKENFDLFYKDEKFVGWCDQSTAEFVQIGIPKEKIVAFKFVETASSFKFYCVS